MSGIAHRFNQGWKNRYLLIFLLILFSGFACDGNGEDNDSPAIFDLDAPDFIPVGFTQTIYFHLSVDDNQGLDDIESVYFVIQNPA